MFPTRLPRNRLFHVALFAAIQFAVTTVHADGLASILRKAARVADEVPIQSSDDVLSRLRKLPNLRPTDEALEAVGEAALRNPDDIRAAAVLVDGARRMDQAIPDVQVRSSLLSRSGNDAMQAAGLRSGAADDLVYLDRYLARRDIDLPAGISRPTMADFAGIASDDARWAFWQKYVQPNKKLWASGAALAAYLAAPEMWHDAAGNISEKVIGLAGDLGGELLAGIFRGLGTAGEDLGDQIGDEMKNLGSKTFSGWLGTIAIVAIIAVFLIASLRKRAIATFKKLVLGDSESKTDPDSF